MAWTRLPDLRSADGTRLAAWRMAPGVGVPVPSTGGLPAGSAERASDALSPVGVGPEGPPRWGPGGRGDVLVFGGLADHMGRYVHVGEALAAAGWRVTGVDLRGNGLSDGRRGHVMRGRDYVEDVEAAAQSVGGNPVIVAHSTGGLAVLDWLRTHEARAVVLSAPLLRAGVKAPRWKLAAAGLLSRALPWLSLANEIPAGHISRDAEIVRSYQIDPLVYGTLTPRWYTEMTAAGVRVLEHAPRYRTPALIMWGSGERLVDPSAVAELACTYGGPHASRTWDGLYHEIFNEPERAQVLAHTTAWLDGIDGAAAR